LRDLPDVIQGNIQKPQGFNLFKSSEPLYFILREIQGVQSWQVVKPCNVLDVVSAQIKLLDPEAIQVLNRGDRVAVQTQKSEVSVEGEPVDRLNQVVVQVQMLQVDVQVAALDPVDRIA
jgi:hypothetical protein